MPIRPPQSCASIRRFCAFALGLILTLSFTSPTRAAEIQDLVRLKGAETGKIVGMGLVFGLNGTGDGGKYLPAMRPLASVIQRFMDGETVAAELRDARNVALVALSATIPAHGVREGDRLDVHVTSIGPAKSLEGGRLFVIPMTGPLPNSGIFAYAEGAITIEDPAHPTTAVVKDGAQMVVNNLAQYMDERGRMTLILNDQFATWPMARNVAGVINDRMAPDGPTLAQAVDQRSVMVQIPEYEQGDPADFIARVLESFIDAQNVKTEARVVINERTGTIVVTGDVEIAPVIISHKGLTITTITPTPEQALPVEEENAFLALDPERRGGTRLADLLQAFNQLKVEAKDRIAIIKELERSGKLLGQVVVE